MKREGIIVGGGASGLMAAIAAAESGASVTILEHMPRVGKKILSTGNGKCNMTNYHMTADCYRCDEGHFPMQVIEQFPVKETISFFRRLGVLTTDRDGYVYPASGQAQAVLDALRGKTESLGIRTLCDCHIKSVKKTKTGKMEVQTSQGNYVGDFVILATGSMAAPSTGSDGSGYELAKALGHTIKKPLPALVQLKCKGDWFKSVAGVRADAKISLYTVGKTGEGRSFLAADTGELQLTDYGISGIPVFQISRYAAEALDKQKQVQACVDFMPGCSREELHRILKEQRTYLSDRSCEEFLSGMFNKKLAFVMLKAADIKISQRVSGLSDQKLKELCEVVKSTFFEVTATNPYDKAQICMGGVRTCEVNPKTMESKVVPGLYLTGELLDVDGICGGYNLQWAWSSGYVAGVCAACGESASAARRNREDAYMCQRKIQREHMSHQDRGAHREQGNRQDKGKSHVGGPETDRKSRRGQRGRRSNT